MGAFSQLFGQPESRKRRISVTVFWGLIGFALVVVAAFVLPPVLVTGVDGVDRLRAENDIRGTLLQALAGGLFLITALFTWRQIQVAREGQITERYAKAVELLKSDDVVVRTGGVYALQRVARDSPSDRTTINLVLSAFIRSRSDRESKKERERDMTLTDIHDALAALGSPDLQTAGKRPGHLPLNLSSVQAPKAFLDGVDFSEAMLTWANLKLANLIRANLIRANLNAADLTWADLTSAVITSASLKEAKLTGAKLTGADLTGADLTGADLTGADLTGAETNSILYDVATVWPEGSEANLS